MALHVRMITMNVKLNIYLLILVIISACSLEIKKGDKNEIFALHKKTHSNSIVIAER